MNLGQRMRAAVAGAAIAAAAAATRAGAQPAAAPPASTTATQPATALTPEEDLRQYLDRLAAGLFQGPQQQRDDAAQRLAAIGSAETRATLTKALAGNDERAQNAAARAIADSTAMDPAWLPWLVGMLNHDRTVDAAARALVRYDGEPRAYDPLLRIVGIRQQAARENLIRDLSEVVEKPVAQALVGFVTDASEDAAVRAAAADALAELSGQARNDPRGWQAWWNARQGLSPADWRAQVLREQHPVLQQDEIAARDRVRKFKQNVAEQFKDLYGRAAPADKPKMMLGLLADPDPDMRDIGAQLVSSAITAGQPVTDEVHTRLINLVGDASPEVRQQVARVLHDLADPNALDAILTQLQVESNTDVKIALLKAVASQQSGKARAVPVIERMLQDPSPRVAAEAASALQAMAPVIGTNTLQSRAVFQDLQNAMQARTGPPGTPNDDPGSDDLRAAVVSAMATFARAYPQDGMDVFQQLVNPNERAPVRRAAVQGLASLGERAAEIIAQELSVNNEPDMSVRQAAAVALGQIGSFGYAQRLYDSTQQQVEPEKLVRDAAWKAFQSLLQAPSTTLQELYTWADIFHRQKSPDHGDHEVIVRKELARKLQAAKNLEALALERQRIGEIYLGLNPPQYADAVPYLRETLDYWEQNQEQNQANPQTVVRLVTDLMTALLQSGQFREAIRIGEQEIHRDKSNQEVVGPLIRNAADELVGRGDPVSLRDAAMLIGDALAMNPPLDETYRDRLQTLKQALPANPPGS